MKAIIAATLCLSLSGCWFVYIPGSALQAISDGLTGDKGDNCVSAGAKVGDRVRTPGGGGATITHVSGTSMRCQNPALPVRAMLAFD